MNFRVSAPLVSSNPATVPASAKVLSYAERLKAQADDVKNHAMKRLCPIIVAAVDEDIAPRDEPPPLPPLFTQFWREFEQIEDALTAINKILLRVEI